MNRPNISAPGGNFGGGANRPGFAGGTRPGAGGGRPDFANRPVRAAVVCVQASATDRGLLEAHGREQEHALVPAGVHHPAT